MTINQQAEAWLENVNYSEKYNCIFIHIPKTAGSSIAQLLGLSGSSHLTYSELLQTRFYQNHPELPAFAVVRDPLSRFISLNNYARMPISAYHNNIDPAQAPYGAHDDYALLAEASLDQAVAALIAGRLVHDRRWNQWRPQTVWTQAASGQPAPGLQLIHLEHLHQGLEQVLQQPLPPLPRLNPSAGARHSSHPSRRWLKQLVDYYQADYAAFGYPKPQRKLGRLAAALGFTAR